MSHYFILLLIPIAFLNIWWGYTKFQQRKSFYIVLSGLISLGLSFLFPWSIGPLLFAVGIIKVYVGLFNSKAFKNSPK